MRPRTARTYVKPDVQEGDHITVIVYSPPGSHGEKIGANTRYSGVVVNAMPGPGGFLDVEYRSDQGRTHFATVPPDTERTEIIILPGTEKAE